MRLAHREARHARPRTWPRETPCPLRRAKERTARSPTRATPFGIRSPRRDERARGEPGPGTSPASSVGAPDPTARQPRSAEEVGDGPPRPSAGCREAWARCARGRGPRDSARWARRPRGRCAPGRGALSSAPRLARCAPSRAGEEACSPASSKGRTGDFESPNRGSNPRAGTAVSRRLPRPRRGSCARAGPAVFRRWRLPCPYRRDFPPVIALGPAVGRRARGGGAHAAGCDSGALVELGSRYSRPAPANGPAFAARRPRGPCCGRRHASSPCDPG